jgi:putative aminopeptidase FrvX
MALSLGRLASLAFSGDTRKGPRHAYVLSHLMAMGCSPTVDSHGNIWVERSSLERGKAAGSRRRHQDKEPTILISSHLDVDPRVRDLSFSSYRENGKRMVSGVLDNAVGCCINLRLAAKRPASGRIIHVFTASEEIERGTTRGASAAAPGRSSGSSGPRIYTLTSAQP